MKRFISVIVCLVMLLGLFSLPGLAAGVGDLYEESGETETVAGEGSDSSDKDTGEDTEPGSDEDTGEDTEPGSDEDAGQETEPGSDEDTGEDTEQGTDEDSGEDTEQGSDEDAGGDTEQDPDGDPDGETEQVISRRGYTLAGGVLTVSDTQFGIAGEDKPAIAACVIESGVTEIPMWYFDQCAAMESVIIPDSVTEIGFLAFSDCSELKSVVIPDSVTTMGTFVFKNCTSLVSVRLSSSLSAVPSCTFQGCTALKKVVVPDGAESLGSLCFSQCASLESVELPLSLKSIGVGAFREVKEGLTIRYAGTEAQWAEVEIASANSALNTAVMIFAEEPTYLGGGELEDTDIRWVVTEEGELIISGTGDIPDFEIVSEGKKDVVINTPWFGLREEIVRITVEEGITGIGAMSFRMLVNAGEATLPEGVTCLGDQAFYACVLLRTVELPSTLQSIGDRAFVWAPLERIDLPDGLKSIGAGAFGLNELKELSLPEGLEYIGPGAFDANEFITELTVPAGLRFGSGDGTNLAFSTMYALETVTVSEGAQTVPARCFSHCWALKTLRLPSTIETLGHDFILLTMYGEPTRSELESIVVAPREGYTFAGWVDENGDFFTSEEIVDGAAYEGDLTAQWLRTWSEDTFRDVREDDWFYDYVRFAYQSELMVGMTGRSFVPNGAATRAQVVTILYRLADEPAEGGETPFSDVPGGMWYSEAVAWAADSGVASGYDDGTFHPNRAVTRQEFVTLLMNMAVYMGAAFPEDEWEDSYLADFPDAEGVAAWARQAESWSVAVGLQSGSLDSNGVSRLNPDSGLTRAELATYMTGFCTGLDEIYEKALQHMSGEPEDPTGDDPDGPTGDDPAAPSMSDAAALHMGKAASFFEKLFGAPLKLRPVWDENDAKTLVEENWYYDGGFCLIVAPDPNTGEYIITGWVEAAAG